MNDDLRSLLTDLARYLEQQRQAGSSFYLEAEEPVEEPDHAVPVQDQDAAETPAAPVPPGGVPAAAPSPPRDPARSEREQAFERECQAFVRDTLTLIARTRSHGSRPGPAGPEQTDIFGAAADPVAAPEALEAPEAPADRATALEQIGEEARACTRCPLHEGRQNAVPGTGNPGAGLVLVGEAPGAEEDRQGLPFVGRSGQLLTDILKAIGFARDEVFICNILKCRPPQNRDPERAEVQACEPYLRRQLAVIRPRLILCLGRVAAQTLLGTTAPLGSLRRSVHFFAGVPVMATYHPAALLRNPGQKRDTWDDVRKLRALHDALGEKD